MLFSDHALSCRLEAAEGYACRQFAMARRRLFPECGSDAIRVAGADVVFDGPDSPVTQTFGLGLFQPLASEHLEAIEGFFRTRGAPTQHEISPFAGTVTLQLLCARGYQPIEVSHVLYRPIELPIEPSARVGPSTHISVRVIDHKEAALWSEVNVRGWTHEHPEFEPCIGDMGAVFVNRVNSPCFIAEIDGQACAAGALAIHEGVALFAGASTIPEFRRRGLQTALLEARMRFGLRAGM
jgi:hypothetical protein